MSRQVTARVIGQRRRILLELPQAKFRQSPIAVSRADEIRTGLAPVRQPIEQRLVKRLDARVPDSKSEPNVISKSFCWRSLQPLSWPRKASDNGSRAADMISRLGAVSFLKAAISGHWRVTNCE